ncbi:hypothetical protein JL720_10576 [Aureococcus anophagefferens]|nr:hypothetical protein JL720_10576 [Aureococcus anophagefferens]
MSFTKKKKATNFDDLVKVVLETAFREIDLDGDGTLDSEELKAVGFSIEVMQRFDTNRDGKLDQSEFVDALSAAVSTKSDPDAANKIELTAAAKAAAKELAAAKAELGALAEGKAAMARELAASKSEASAANAKIAKLMASDCKGAAPCAPAPVAAPAAPAAAAPSDAAEFGFLVRTGALLALGGCFLVAAQSMGVLDEAGLVAMGLPPPAATLLAAFGPKLSCVPALQALRPRPPLRAAPRARPRSAPGLGRRRLTTE